MPYTLHCGLESLVCIGFGPSRASQTLVMAYSRLFVILFLSATCLATFFFYVSIPLVHRPLWNLEDPVDFGSGTDMTIQVQGFTPE